MSARDEILSRIRAALADRPAPAPIPRNYRRTGSITADLDLFVERVADYRANVYRCPAGEIAGRIAELAGRRRLAVPDGFPAEWLPAGLEVAHEPLTSADLDELDGALATCAVAVAETGTIILDHGPGQGPRALSLVPDYLLVVVRAEQVRAIVPDAVAALDPVRPQTWISGPSATSDIELNRVEGVHGPRTLDVILGL
ncbi:MAG TPA: LUD domain-containing protein [Jatrophihabitantaceae bacterium]|nr:LUD domain-containing protein [Jatrophihabitantaceae bacterium]